MALITCPECGKKNVSDTAEACPKCGYGIKKHFEEINAEDIDNKESQIVQEISSEENNSSSENSGGSAHKSLLMAGIIILSILLIVIIKMISDNSVQKDYVLHALRSSAHVVQENDNSFNMIDIFRELSYLKGKELLSDKQYDKAILLFTYLGIYEDSNNLLTECNYQYANSCFSDGKYTEAKEIYTMLDDYEESHNKVLECAYYIAKGLYEKEDYYSVAEIFYEYGEDLLTLHEAVSLKDTICSEKSEWFVNKAEEEYNSGNFDKADVYFEFIGFPNLANRVAAIYEYNSFMRSIQGDFYLEDGKPVSIEGFIYHGEAKKYEITPIERITDNGDRSIVGMLDGDKDYFIKYVTDDELWWIRNSIYDSWRILRTEEALKDYNEYISEREEQKKADVKAEPSIGMTADEVRNSSWGEPKKINKTTYEWGTSEQWVYSLDRYVYLENGRVTAIQE